jgi:hypothetical protein
VPRAGPVGLCTTKVLDRLDTTKNSGPCPVVGSVFDMARYVEFDGSGQKLYPNIAYTGEISDVRLYCRYTGSTPLEAEIEIDFAFGKGPKADASRMTIRYFVTVTRRDRSGAGQGAVRRERDVPAGRRGHRARDREGAGIVIPRANETVSGTNFEVIVGFDLTPEQLAYNRSAPGSRSTLRPPPSRSSPARLFAAPGLVHDPMTKSAELAGLLSDAAGAAFVGLGLEASLGAVRRSDRPDLADFQCNGAMAAAKKLAKNPREIADGVVVAR